jgi:hypothetical protein
MIIVVFATARKPYNTYFSIVTMQNLLVESCKQGNHQGNSFFLVWLQQLDPKLQFEVHVGTHRCFWPTWLTRNDVFF